MSTSFAATRPINPAGAEPVLTKEQVWKALAYKSRYPKEFVPAIYSCSVTKDEGNQVSRDVQFGNESAPTVTENITLFEPTIVYFDMSTPPHGRITNIISHAPNNELLLTYTFANGIPALPADAEGDADKINAHVGKGVQHSIDVMRKMAKEGKI